MQVAQLKSITAKHLGESIYNYSSNPSITLLTTSDNKDWPRTAFLCSWSWCHTYEQHFSLTSNRIKQCCLTTLIRYKRYLLHCFKARLFTLMLTSLLNRTTSSIDRRFSRSWWASSRRGWSSTSRTQRFVLTVYWWSSNHWKTLSFDRNSSNERYILSILCHIENQLERRRWRVCKQLCRTGPQRNQNLASVSSPSSMNSVSMWSTNSNPAQSRNITSHHIIIRVLRGVVPVSHLQEIFGQVVELYSSQLVTFYQSLQLTSAKAKERWVSTLIVFRLSTIH